MAGILQCIKHLNRHPCLTANSVKSTNLGICLFARNGFHKLNVQLFRSVRCVQAPTISSNSSYRGVLNKLFQNTNKVMLVTCGLGVVSGLGAGILASSCESKRLKSALAAEPTDPTTIESGWLPKTEEIYAKFLSRVDSGELKLLRTTKEPLGRVVYTISHPQRGAHFEYALFYETATQKGHAIIQFGPKTQGPPGHVHGGATAAMFDTVTGVFLHKGLEKRCLTANLNINYRRPIPLNSTVVAETWVEKVEGRKNYVHCELKSTDGQVYIEGTALWITV